jgi:hypothetical protein
MVARTEGTHIQDVAIRKQMAIAMPPRTHVKTITVVGIADLLDIQFVRIIAFYCITRYCVKV